jgi:hypothetical protein
VFLSMFSNRFYAINDVTCRIKTHGCWT